MTSAKIKAEVALTWIHNNDLLKLKQNQTDLEKRFKQVSLLTEKIDKAERMLRKV